MTGEGIAFHNDINAARMIAAVDMVNKKEGFYDDNGHGTHVAGILGAKGASFVGMAPGCKYISVKVLDSKGDGKLSNVLKGLEWLCENHCKYNIRIVNISVGTPVGKSFDETSGLVKLVDRLWEEGCIVVAAAGNNGPGAGSVGAPGISRKIITVGACDDNYRGMGYRNYSGRGPTESCIRKPDIVAPGSRIYSCSNMPGRRQYAVKSGTSMATPVVSGAIALLLSKYPGMTGKDVKIRLRDRAIDLGLPHHVQGWGMINVRRLLYN